MIYRSTSLILKHGNALKWLDDLFALRKESEIPSPGQIHWGKSNKDPACLFFVDLRTSESGDTLHTVRDMRATWLRLLSPHRSPGLIQIIWQAGGIPFAFHSIKLHICSRETPDIEKPSYGQEEYKSKQTQIRLWLVLIRASIFTKPLSILGTWWISGTVYLRE